MTLQRFAAAALLLVLTACQAAAPQSQFGSYPERPKQIRLAGGETFPVYRVKHWLLDGGASTAVQLEYEPPVLVSDTAELRRLAHRLWPAFAPYVEEADVSMAIVTATNLRKRGSALAWFARINHFGLVANRDAYGDWRFDGEADPLPLPELGGPPTIFEANGSPLPPTVFLQVNR